MFRLPRRSVAPYMLARAHSSVLERLAAREFRSVWMHHRHERVRLPFRPSRHAVSTFGSSEQGLKPQMQILSYSPRRSRALLELARLALGETRERRKTPELWSWKHGRNPFGRSQGLYAWDTEAARAIGLRMLMRWSFRRADASIVRALRAVDTATHPDWRRRGIFSTLTRRALEDARKEACFIFNTPNAASFAGYEKLGWKNVARFSIFRRTLVAPRSAASGEPWDVCFSRGVLPFSEFLERHARQARTIVRDWEEMRGCSGLRTPRSLAYLRWRYAGHPQIRYGVQALVVRGALLGGSSSDRASSPKSAR